MRDAEGVAAQQPAILSEIHEERLCVVALDDRFGTLLHNPLSLARQSYTKLSATLWANQLSALMSLDNRNVTFESKIGR